jgi:hypothetical protein
MEQFDNQTLKWTMKFFLCLIHPEFLEEIEGDLLEKYHADLEKYGHKVAQKRLYAELFSILKINLIFNLTLNPMKRHNWFILFVITFVVVLASIAPLLPGPSNDFSHTISQFVQVIGNVGWVFVPFGLIWLIVEIRNKKGQKLNLWTNGYYPSWLVMIPFIIFLLLLIVVAIREGLAFEGWSLKGFMPFIVIISVITFFVYHIQKLKQKTAYKFNKVPLYICLIPIVLLITSQFVVEKAATFRRNQSITKTTPLIVAIDQYKATYGDYPEKLEDLEGKYISEIPKLNVMGIQAYHYEKKNGYFQLSFEQFWHWNATEVVVYNPTGDKDIKGNYEKYAVNKANWWYYLAD